MKNLIVSLILMISMSASAQVKKVYDESINPMTQIDNAVALASKEGKNVILQVGGNWCRWCLMLADFIEKDEEISKMISDNYVYVHVNYSGRTSPKELTSRINNAGRFGYPALVVLRPDGSVLHIQDSSFLEEGEGYNKAKVLRFLKNWTPEAIKEE